MVSCLISSFHQFWDNKIQNHASTVEAPPRKNCLGLVSTEGRILPELAWKGFDAIQIPPAQVSPNGGNLVLL